MEIRKDIEFLQSMSAEEYRDYKADSHREAADMVSGYTWRTFLWLLLFIGSCFPPVYALNKRIAKNPEGQKGILFSTIFALLGGARTRRYRRADGTTYDDNSEFLGSVVASIALVGVSIILELK